MAILFDAASNSGYNTALSSISWSHTIAGTDRLLIVTVSMLSVVGSSVSSITFDGVALTKVRHDVSVSGTIRTEIWYLIAPALGTKTVAVTLSTALDSVAGAISLNGVDQVNPIDAQNGATGVGTTATVDVTTVKNNALVVDVVSTSDTAITVGSGQTQRNNVSGTLGSGANSTEGPKTLPGAVTMSWDAIGAADSWTISGVSITPVAEIDSYFQNTSQPIEKTRPVKRLQYLYPSLFRDTKVLINHGVISGPYVHVIFDQVFQYQSFSEPLIPKPITMAVSGPYVRVIFDQVFQYQSYTKPLVPIIKPITISGPYVHVIFDQMFQYKSFTEPLENDLRIPEVIRPDKWTGSHPDYVWDKKHHEFQYPSLFIDPNQLTQHERIDIDKWFVELQRPPKGPKHWEYLYPFLTIDAEQLTQLERLTMDKWFMRLSEPRWDVKRQQWIYPTRDDRTELLILKDTPIDAMFQQIDYIFRDKFRPYYYPYLSIDPSFLLDHERIDLDKWYKELERPPKGPKHWEYLYPPFSTDPTHLPINMDKWYKELERPPKGPKHWEYLYPPFSWYPKIIIAPMVIQGSHVQVIFTQTFQYRQIAEALKIFIYIWKRTEEGTSSFSKVVEGTAVFTKVVEASASFTKVAKSVPTWSKEVESASTWTKDTEPPAVTEVPDD